MTKDMGKFYNDLQNQEYNEELGAKCYMYMSDCINYERQRIGGDWVIAQAVPTRNLREVIRKVLGYDLIFIILRLLVDYFVQSMLSKSLTRLYRL